MSGIGPGFLAIFRTLLALFRTSLATFRTSLAMFRTSLMSGTWPVVRNKASFPWPYSGHQFLMSGIWPGKTGHVPDINVRCPERDQSFLALFRIWLSFPGHVPDITGPIPDITGPIPDTTGPIPDINYFFLAVFRTLFCDVQNRAKKNWPCSGHISVISGIWSASKDSEKETERPE